MPFSRKESSWSIVVAIFFLIAPRESAFALCARINMYSNGVHPKASLLLKPDSCRSQCLLLNNLSLELCHTTVLEC
jgi:hypothetical protein